ncbi:MAG: hypothetical protein AAFV80_05835, partial [Bacteroidota bacterium]
MTPEFLEIVVALTSIAAIVIPIVINYFQKENKIKKSIYLIELLRTQKELDSIIAEQADKDQSPILQEKLNRLKTEIDEELYSIEGKAKFQFYFIVVAFEILVIFSNIGYVVVFEPSHKNSIRFFEGILNPPMARIFLILGIFIFASLITFSLAKRLKSTIPDYWKFNFLMI